MSFLSRYRYFSLLILITVVSEFIVNPVGDFPLNDDWCYGKAVYYSSLDKFTVGGFGAMTLATHILWGMLFTKLFGFTFTVLRFSTLLSSLVGLFFLNKLITKITANTILAFCVCLVLLFNPLYFNLSNTFMTDINFNTLLVISCYYAYTFFETRRPLFFILFFLVCIAMVLLRQFGIVLPLCFTLACFALKEKRWQWLVFSLMGVMLVYFSLKVYEQYLITILPKISAYKFSGSVKISDRVFWDTLFLNMNDRFKSILLQVLVYSSPLVVFFISAISKSYKRPTVVLIFGISGFIVYNFFYEKSFVMGNVFSNMSLGPETFYESLYAVKGHNYSGLFSIILDIMNWALPTLTVGTLFMFLITFFRSKRLSELMQPNTLFLVAFVFMYVFMILITESYFDRYHLPLITVCLILVGTIGMANKPKLGLEFVVVSCFFYISVFGTKDYLSLNNTRWEAYRFLRTKEHVTAKQVNGGFELNCWNDAKPNWWANYKVIKPYDYLIQFKVEAGFKLYKEYEFQRYLPYKKDKISIFVREDKK